jgi:VanZ family protein
VTKKTLLRAAPIVWAALVIALHAIPGKDLPDAPLLSLFQFDKFIHAALFGVLAWLIMCSLPNVQHNTRKRWIGVFTACVLFGIGLEFAQQHCFAERSADVYDAIADAIGSLAGLIIFRRYSFRL